jgi:hypothetical protein
MRKYTTWFAILILILVIAGGFWVIKKRSFQPVVVGDTKTVVLAKLGHPNTVFTNTFALLIYGGEVWAYGREFDLKAAAKGDFPFRFGFLVPKAGDSIIVFDGSNVVKSLGIAK